MALTDGQNYALYAVFADGFKCNGKTKVQFYSRDYKRQRDKQSKSNGQRNDKIGIIRFFKWLKKNEHKLENFSIYDHRTGCPADGKLLFKWNRGRILHDDLTANFHLN